MRASWGRIGNISSVPIAYKSPVLDKTSWNEQAQYGVASNTVWGNIVFIPTDALNVDLTWETSEQTDLGLDVEMFNNRLSLSMDYLISGHSILSRHVLRDGHRLSV